VGEVLEGTEQFVATDYEEILALGSRSIRSLLAAKKRGGAGLCYLWSQRSGGSEILLGGRPRRPQPSFAIG